VRFLRSHAGWMIMLALAIALLAGRAPLLHSAGDKAARDLDATRTAREKTEQDLAQLRNDVAAARKISSEIDRAHAEDVLAPTDRLKAAVLLERAAAGQKISHFTYTLAPEGKTVIETGGAPQNLALSAVTLAGDAPDDLYIYKFIEQAERLLPGRARLQEVKITRKGTDAPRAADNAHFETTLEWLSNGSLQTVAGGP
jgi:hypothetical protein